MGRNRKCVEHAAVVVNDGRKRTQPQYVCRKCFKNGNPTKIQLCGHCGGWHTTHNFGRESAHCNPSSVQQKHHLKRTASLDFTDEEPSDDEEEETNFTPPLRKAQKFKYKESSSSSFSKKSSSTVHNKMMKTNDTLSPPTHETESNQFQNITYRYPIEERYHNDETGEENVDNIVFSSTSVPQPPQSPFAKRDAASMLLNLSKTLPSFKPASSTSSSVISATSSPSKSCYLEPSCQEEQSCAVASR